MKRKSARLLFAALMGLACTISPPVHADKPAPPLNPPVSRDNLFWPGPHVGGKIAASHGGLNAKQIGPAHWSITGTLKADAGSVRLVPTNGSWDFSKHSLFSIRLRNEGPGTVWIEARLENNGAQDWANSSVSQSYLLPGETGVVTVGFPRGWDKDDSPEAFEPTAAKPNGWRSHWKSFNASDVKACRIVVRSSHKTINLTSVNPYLAWPYGMEPNKPLNALPHIDRFGQAIPFDWPTKIKSDADLIAQRNEEAQTLAGDPGPRSFNKYGGYADGPQRKATGFFRAEKIDGKWWLIDPDGRLYWSNGVCTVGNRSITNLSKARRPLFAYLPEPGTDEHKIGIVVRNKIWFYDFLRVNTARKYGEGWEDTIDELTHKRLRAWGINTLGSWSDDALMDAKKTPYTEIIHLWRGMKAIDATPDPFSPGFEKRCREAVARLAEKRGQDPWMVGVFIDNEVHWYPNMVERVLKLGPDQPAYSAFVQTLKKQYESIAALNKAWGTDASDWNKLVPGKTDAYRQDSTALYAQMADRYYRICKQATAELLPNHLYLGSRVHTAPAVVLAQMARHVDVYSANHYAPLAGRAGLPQGVDKPVIISEFHFGTIDRGVTGMSLCPVHDQTQRARNYAAYMTAGLIHPNVVGAHWFAYSDHSTVGRPNENYQIGLIDITDRPYDGFVAMTRSLSEHMYRIRLDPDAELLDEVQKVIEAAER